MGQNTENSGRIRRGFILCGGYVLTRDIHYIEKIESVPGKRQSNAGVREIR